MSCSIFQQAVHLAVPYIDTGQVTLFHLSLQRQTPLQLVHVTMRLCTGAVLKVAQVFANLCGLS